MHPKVYALHAPEITCIGKGEAKAKAKAFYGFGCEVSIAAPEGAQFVLHARALHGNPMTAALCGRS